MTDRRLRLASILPDALGMAWTLAAAIAVIAPALAHGASLGPFDQLSRYGLSSRPGVVVHYTGPGDQIEMLIPWTTLAWTQVHTGHLPLWNPYSALGMPLVFNWQSAAFSVPALVGYLFPVHLAFTVAEVVTLFIAGGGAYFLGRVLRLGVLGATTAATVYELSGPLVGWLGWPNAAAMSWAGWIFAAAILIVRARHRARDIALFAIVLACAVYAGQPETVVLFALALTVFLAVFLAIRARRSPGPAPVVRPILDLAIAAAAGAALSAPLAFPGLQLASASVVRVASSYGALAPHNVENLLFQGFDGLPVAGNHWFGNSIYPETATYLGIIALALAVVAIGSRWRRPEVPALLATAIAMAAMAYIAPVVSAINQLTNLRSVAWHRSLQPMVFALAVLAGIGIDTLVRSGEQRSVRRWAGGAFVTAGLILAIVWFAGRGQLPTVEAGIRARSFLWPLVSTVLGLLVMVGLALAHRGAGGRHASLRSTAEARRWAGIILLSCQTAFLISAGAPLIPSSPTFFAPTPAEAALQRAVGSALVAFGSRDCHTPPTLGIHQDANVVYAVHELADWDPMVPEATFASLASATRQPASSLNAPLILCPAVDNARTARRYGVGFILDHAGSPRPPGTNFVASLGDEKLYRVPGTAAATLTPLTADGSYPAPDAIGVPVALTHPEPSAWRIVGTAPAPAVLRLHLTDVPGWHATIDGRPLRLVPLSGTMLQATFPAGRHTVELQYWPTAFTAGLVVALASLIGLSMGLVVARRRRHR